MNHIAPRKSLTTKRLFHGSLSLALIAMIESSGIAATATTTFIPAASVSANCLVSTANALAFPAFAPGSGSQNASTTLGVKCTTSTPFHIGLNAGTGSGATTTTRYMTSGTNKLAYQLFTDANHTINWGNNPGSDTVDGTGLGLATEITKTIYGQIPSQPNAVPGAYRDTVTITVTY